MRVHANIILKLGILLNDDNVDNSVFELGQHLMELGADRLTNGGFWIWDIQQGLEFYSPHFRSVLGFNDEIDFPSTPNSWQKQIDKEDLKISVANYNKALSNKDSDPYYQEVTYKTKKGDLVDLLCSGSLILDGNNKPRILVGTHVLL